MALDPGNRIEIATEAAPVGIPADGFDAGIRPGDMSAQEIIGRRIGPADRFAIEAAPVCQTRTPGDRRTRRPIAAP